MPEDNSLKDVMLKASAIMIAILVASKFLGYLSHFIFVRFFTKEYYGFFVYAWSLALFMCGLLIPNIGSSIKRYVAYYRGSRDTEGVASTIRTGILLNLGLSLIAVAVVSVIYYFGFIPQLDHPSFLFVVSVLFINSMASLFANVIAGYRRPEVSSFFNMIQNMLRVLAVAAAALLVVSLYGIMALVLVSFLLSTLIIVSYERRHYGFGSCFDWGIAKKLFSFGFFNVFYVTANNILTWADIFLIQFFLGSAVVAVYNVSWLASTVSLLFFTAVLQIFNPVVTEFFGGRKHDKITYLTSYLLESFLLLFLPIFLSVVLFAREILVLFVTAEYAQGTVPLQILSVGGFFFGIAMLFIELINAEGKPEVNAKNIGLGAVLNVGLNIVLIPSHGMVGAAFATLASSIFILYLSFIHVRGVIPLSFSPGRIGKVVCSSLFAVAAVFIVKKVVEASTLSLVLSLLALGAVYMIFLIVFKSLRSEDVILTTSLLEKFRAPKGIVDRVRRNLEYGVQPTTSS